MVKGTTNCMPDSREKLSFSHYVRGSPLLGEEEGRRGWSHLINWRPVYAGCQLIKAKLNYYYPSKEGKSLGNTGIR